MSARDSLQPLQFKGYTDDDPTYPDESSLTTHFERGEENHVPRSPTAAKAPCRWTR